MTIRFSCNIAQTFKQTFNRLSDFQTDFQQTFKLKNLVKQMASYQALSLFFKGKTGFPEFRGKLQVISIFRGAYLS